jgi:RecQ family ATP-dependent DNA helicase
MTLSERITAACKKLFGYAPKPIQLKLCKKTLLGKNVFAVLPTGYGKTICIVIPAFLAEPKHVTIVFSPLIALMKDQVERCNQVGIAAATMSSDQSEEQQQEIYSALRKGKLRILFIAPERLKNKEFVEAISKCAISAVVMDESHTIRDRSSYRPGFSEIIKFSALFPDVPKLALTATADEEVEREVVRSLRMLTYARVVAPPRRDNISYEARTNMTEQDLMREIRRVGDGAKIIYCASRKSAEAMATLLKGHGLSADCYHAGLDKHVKNKAQDNFKDGETEIMCATNAFGLGIDVANVRLVVSWHLPQDVFEMVQLAGRGGRDGLPSRFILNVSKEGLRLRNYFTNIGNPKIYVYQRIWEYLCRKVKPKGVLRLPESALAKVAGCPTGMEGWAMSALSYMEHHRLLSSSAGTKTYRLPVQNMELARSWAKRVGGDIIHGKLVFTVTQNEDDPASRIWNSGACAKDAPDSALAIRRIARTMTITERDLAQKKNKDSAKTDDLVMFAGTTDKAAYIDACFLKSAEIV